MCYQKLALPFIRCLGIAIGLLAANRVICVLSKLSDTQAWRCALQVGIRPSNFATDSSLTSSVCSSPGISPLLTWPS